MAALPCPASFEYNPLLIPISIVFSIVITAPPPAPIIVAFGLKTPLKIKPKDSPILSTWYIRTRMDENT